MARKLIRLPAFDALVAGGNIMKDMAEWCTHLYVTSDDPQTRRAIKMLGRGQFFEGPLNNCRSAFDDVACRIIPRIEDPKNLAIKLFYGERLTADEALELAAIEQRLASRNAEKIGR